MSNDSVLNIQIHLKDESEIVVHRVPSTERDFVSLKLGWQTSVLLFNSDQAMALSKAVMDAYSILKNIELDDEEVDFSDIDDTDCSCSACQEYEYTPEENCTDDSPCSLCLSY